MAGPKSHLEVEMFLDEATFAAAIGQQPKWLIRGGSPPTILFFGGAESKFVPQQQRSPFQVRVSEVGHCEGALRQSTHWRLGDRPTDASRPSPHEE